MPGWFHENKPVNNYDANALINVNPRFADPSKNNFTVMNTTAMQQVGFTNIPMNNFGKPNCIDQAPIYTDLGGGTTGASIYGNDTSSNTTRTGSGWSLQSGSKSCYSVKADDAATFTVNLQNDGDMIKWYGIAGGDHGIANVYIDGVLTTSVDCYSTSRLVDTLLFTSDPMSSGNHTIKIVVTGNHNESANGTYIEIYRIMDFFAPSKSISGVTFDPIANQTYTGKEITPTFTVKDGATTLVPNTDYTISYSDNTNVGTASVIIVGIGKYTDSASTTFTIFSAVNSGTTIYGNDISSNTTRTGSGWSLQSGSKSCFSYVANDSATFTVTVQNSGDKIQWYGVAANDHGIANVYIDGVLKTAVDCYSATRQIDTLLFTSDPMSSGNHTLKIVVTGTYNASASGNYIEIYRIIDCFTASKSISGATFDPIANQIYTGNVITPAIAVKDGTTTLVLNTDYTISCSNNINVGTASVTIIGKGNYKDTASTTFTIFSAVNAGVTIYGSDTSSNTTRTGSGWGFQSTSSYSVTANDSVTFTVNVKNNGDTIQWYGVVGDDHGIANVYIDGVLKKTVDCYSTTRLVDTLLFTSDLMTSGNHTIKIVVTRTPNASSYNNYIEIYRIMDCFPTPLVNLSSYKVSNVEVIGNVISDINPGIKVSAFKTSISPIYGSVVLKNSKSTDITNTSDALIGTGTTLEVTENSITTTYTIIIYGDVNGDSKINLNDFVTIRNNILGKEVLTEANKFAGDLYGEGQITLNSLVGMMSAISLTGTINQNR
jgi:hypothetical protein